MDVSMQKLCTTAKRRNIPLPSDVKKVVDLVPYISCIQKEKSLSEVFLILNLNIKYFNILYLNEYILIY